MTAVFPEKSFIDTLHQYLKSNRHEGGASRLIYR
jgi:hypothetical protein